MRYVDIPFPDCIAFGAQSDPLWCTEIATTRAGWEVAAECWTYNKHIFDVSFAIRTATEYGLVRTHFNQVRGRARTFPFKDYLDFTATAAEGIAEETADDSDSEGRYQMFKKYGTGDDAYFRKITRPVEATCIIYRTRSAVTTVVTGSAAIDDTTGTFFVAGDMEGDVYTWAGEFNVPCRYGADQLPAAITNKEPAADGELLVECGSISIVEVRE
jgi:uncharacterized protein (TIGR02217 family)